MPRNQYQSTGVKFFMRKQFGTELTLLVVACLTITFCPAPMQDASAQNFQRREDSDSGGRGGRGRGRFGGDNGDARGRFGGDNGGRGIRRGGEGFGERGRGFPERSEGRSGEAPGGPRPGGSTPNSSSDRPSSSAGGANLNMEEYVRKLVKEHDKNGDMMLQADEQKGLSGKAATADLDKDGVITSNELMTTLSGNAPAGSTASSSPTSSNSGEGSDGGDGDRGRRGDRRRGREGDGRSGTGTTTKRVYTALPAKAKSGDTTTADNIPAKRTYRFTRGTDRLPATGLPSWFKSRDTNGDGQVAMSEYSRTWSDRTVDEFRRYDLDNDGIITAKEAAGK
jgi:hypothetical protein